MGCIKASRNKQARTAERENVRG